MIEASGVCEPMPIAQELELIKNGKLDNVVGVVDAARLVVDDPPKIAGRYTCTLL